MQLFQDIFGAWCAMLGIDAAIVVGVLWDLDQKRGCPSRPNVMSRELLWATVARHRERAAHADEIEGDWVICICSSYS
jgi:hypothetical protein